MIKKKEAAIKQLAQKYATVHRPSRRSSYGYRSSNFMSYFGSTHSPPDESDEETLKSEETDLTEDAVEQCIYSLGDHNTYLRFNREPCDRLIQCLKEEFRPDCADEDPECALGITA